MNKPIGRVRFRDTRNRGNHQSNVEKFTDKNGSNF